jgi:hypothetical protein
MAGRQSFAVAIYGVSAADQHVHGWDARRASHVTGFMAAPTSLFSGSAGSAQSICVTPTELMANEPMMETYLGIAAK